jgi:hypothetical protein
MSDMKKHSMGKVKLGESAAKKVLGKGPASKVMAGNVKGKGNLKVSSGMIQKKR